MLPHSKGGSYRIRDANRSQCCVLGQIDALDFLRLPKKISRRIRFDFSSRSMELDRVWVELGS